MKIRLAQISDAEHICVIWIRSIRELCGPLYQNDERLLSEWCSNKTVDCVSEMIQNKKNYFIVIEDLNNSILGIGLLAGHEILACYMSPDALGKGGGKAILLHLEAQARKWCVHKLELGSTRYALGFYLANGYRQTSDCELLLQGVIPYIPMEKVL